jgi:hypothetical protein
LALIWLTPVIILERQKKPLDKRGFLIEAYVGVRRI